MSNVTNDIYTIDRTRFLPKTLQEDPDILAVAQAISGQMTATALEIHKNKIYPRIDELSEEILDILAYDLHVDWYDYRHSVETKRRVIKNSVKVHMKMGTKYAVETATSDVHPKSTVEEWFQYGGEPYFFRLNVDISDTGITSTQQISLVERIHFYKNCRSHLDYIAFQVESTAEIQLGGYAVITNVVEVMPFLVDEINLEATAEAGAFTVSETNLEIQPFLVDEISLEATAEAGAFTSSETSLEILPFLVSGITLDLEIRAGGETSAETSLEIMPFLVKEIELETIVEATGVTSTETSLDVLPLLTDKISTTGEFDVGGKTQVDQKIEISMKENEK
ncbi:MAG: phage tail protein I [Eubacteriales bacterium]